MRPQIGQSNEPLIIQAIEEAILFRQACAYSNLEPLKSGDRERVREYRKLLHYVRGRLIQSRARKQAVQQSRPLPRRCRGGEAPKGAVRGK